MKSWYDVSFWEQPLVDLWTIPHVLWAVFAALVWMRLPRRPFEGFVLTIIAATFWEIGESIIGDAEPLSNRISDIVVAAMGFGAVWYVAVRRKPVHVSSMATVVIVGLAALVTTIIGWVAYVQYA